MDRDIFVSEESKQSPLLIMQISSKDGSMCNIYIGENDSAEQLAKAFCKLHELPDQIIGRVADQINKKRDAALETRIKQKEESATLKREGSPRSRASSADGRSIASSNQHVFDRLHGYADYHNHRRQALSANIARERQNSVDAGTFRHSIGHLSNSPARSLRRSVSAGRMVDRENATGLHEQIYENHQAWMKKREDSLQKQRDELEATQKEQEANNCSFKPTLVSKPFSKEKKFGDKGRIETDSNFNLHHSLHDKHTELEAKLMKRKAEIDAERAKEITGRPVLCATRSPKLAAKRRAQRDGLSMSVCGYDSDSTLGCSSLPSSTIFGRSGHQLPNNLNDDEYTFSDGDSLHAYSRPNSRPSSAPSTAFGQLDMQPNYSLNISTSPPRKPPGQPPAGILATGAMSMNELGSFTPVAALSYTGVEAPIVRLSNSGIEERSTMSQSMNRRPNTTSSGTGAARSTSPGSSVRSIRSNVSAENSIGSKSLSVFDSLYQTRHESNAKKVELAHKYALSNSHTPDIGVNKLRHVENSKAEFVQRLFDHRHYQENLKRFNEHHTFVGEMGRDVDADAKMNGKETAELIHRLTVLDPKARKQRSQNLSGTIVSNMESKKNSKFIANKSLELAVKARHRALSEIFDVLLMSVEFEQSRSENLNDSQETGNNNAASLNVADLNNTKMSNNNASQSEPGTSSNEGSSTTTGSDAAPSHHIPGVAINPETESENGRPRNTRSISPANRRQYIGNKRAEVLSRSTDPQSQSTSEEVRNNMSADNAANVNVTLDLTLARPYLLENMHLADAIAIILKQSVAMGYKSITRAQFVSIADSAIDSGSVPPMNFILSSVSHQKEMPENSDIQAIKYCTTRPKDLPAKKVTEKLIKNRYKLRTAGLQTVEESLHEYGEYKLQRSQQLRGKIKEEEMKECTFSPKLVTKTSWDKARIAADRKRSVEEFCRQTYGVGKKSTAEKANDQSQRLSINSTQRIHDAKLIPPSTRQGGRYNEARYDVVPVPQLIDSTHEATQSVMHVRELLNKSHIGNNERYTSQTVTNPAMSTSNKISNTGIIDVSVIPVRELSAPRPYFE